MTPTETVLVKLAVEHEARYWLGVFRRERPKVDAERQLRAAARRATRVVTVAFEEGGIPVPDDIRTLLEERALLALKADEEAEIDPYLF